MNLILSCARRIRRTVYFENQIYYLTQKKKIKKQQFWIILEKLYRNKLFIKIRQLIDHKRKILRCDAEPRKIAKIGFFF